MKSDQSNQTKPSSKDSEIEDLVEAFTNNLPVQATEIGWEQIGEEQQDFIKSIDQYTQSKLKAFAEEVEEALIEEGETVIHQVDVLEALKAIKEKWSIK